MRSKKVRALSVLLTASLVLSSANTGVSVLAADVDGNVVEEQQVTETAVARQEDVQEELIQTEIKQRLATPEEEALFSKLKENTSLYQLVLKAYNDATGKSLTEANFTYETLSSCEKALDFSKYTEAASITSVEGLGCAKKASTINISTFTKVTEIPAGEFKNCEFTSIELPSSITTIGNQAFLECKNLSEITLQDTVTVLGEQVFAKCTNLSAVHSSKKKNTLPSQLTKLGQQAFLNDAALTEIIIPSFKNGSILQDEPSLFNGCKGLSKVTFGSAITTIPQSAFANAGTESEDGLEIVFEADSQLDKILGSAFSGAKLHETLDLSMCKNLNTIENAAFEGCSKLSTVILPKKTSGTLALKNKVFGKTSLVSMYEKGSGDTVGVTLPNYVNEMGDGCFYNNEVMTKISLSPNLPEIPDYAFDGCISLGTVEQRTESGICKVRAIGDCAFRSTAIADTEFLMSMNQLETIGYQKLEGLSQYGNGTTKQDVEKIGSLAPGGGSIVPNSDNQKYDEKNKAYGSEVFTNCSRLTSVHIPSSVKNIGGRAFYFADYTGVEALLKSNIETIIWETSTSNEKAERIIYPEAFHGNAKMTTMILPEKTGESLTIGKYAFYGDTSLCKIGTSKMVEENILPVTVKSIEEGAFYYCESLPKITIQSTEGGTCPDLGIKVFEKCLSLEEATVPKQITEIPRHFFYDAPLETFNVGDNTSVGITKIDTLAFFGNKFDILDLSKYTSLEEIGSGAFAYLDTIVEPEEKNKGTKAIYPENRGSLLAWDPRLTKVILPKDLSDGGQLYVNSGAFSYQELFTTMTASGREGSEVAGRVYIPDYMYEKDQQGIFHGTGVSKVVWQADTTGKNQWKNIPVNQYMDCPNITKAEDVLPIGNYVETIGKAAFKYSSVQSADLSHYTSLKELGSGSIVDTQNPGVFQDCENLESVILPETSEGVELTIGKRTFYGATKLGDAGAKIHLGSATKLEDEVFANCIKMPAVTFPETLKEIGIKSFSNCVALKTVDFGSLKKIGNNAFEKCIKLVLTEKGLPDSLETIGTNAFLEDEKLGEVTLGSNLTEIGNSAFQKSGVTSIDFAKAHSLKTIGTYAFSETKVKDFRLKNTKVSNISQNLLFGCTELENVELGAEVLYIDQNALAGCRMLKTFEFSSTTTVNNKVFYNRYTNPSTKEAEYTANGGSITISVNTPDETVIPLGRSVNLPYYISEKSFSNFKYMFVGEGLDESIKEHLSVSAKLEDGYYWGKLSNDEGNKYQIPEGPYYTKLETTAFEKRTDINKEVDVIQVTGLKATEKPFYLSIGGSLTFECVDKKTVTAADFSAKYKIVVQDTPFYADLYTDNKRTDNLPYTSLDKEEIIKIQAANGTKSMQYYFDVTNADESTDIAPATYDVVVETDDENVIYPSGSTYGEKTKSYTTTGGTRENNGIKTPNQSGQTFYLILAGVGTAHIKVYPKEHPEYARTYTYQVDSDIQAISLEVPNEYKNGATLGDSFQVFSNYNNCLGQTASAADMSKYSVYSNRKITYTSDDPEYVSIDDRGNVKILKTDQTNKRVTVRAAAPTSREGNNVTQKLDLTIKPKINMYVPGTRFEAFLYKDDGRTVSVPETEAIQATDARGIQYYFDVANKSNADCDSDTYDIVIESDNPDVLYPSNNTGGNKQASYTTTGGTSVNNSTGKVMPNTSRQTFYLVPAGVGTAHIMVYPEGHRDYAKTYTYVVNADIQTITLDVPKEYANEAVPGVSFPIFSSYKNCLGQTVTVEDMSNYSVYSNKGIVYTSDAPEYASVDARGIVTILKADVDSKSVTITATAPTSVDGKVVTSTKKITVKYPDTKVNEDITDAATGAVIAVTKVSKKDLEGEAKFVRPADAGAATVKVPDTVVVNGVQYKVTTVAENAFKNNANVKTIDLGQYVTTIEDNAFYGCKKLTKIIIPSIITKIGKKAFYNCKKLKTVTIPNKAKITEIGDSAFQNCSALTRITIPVNVTKIGAKAFYNCKKLKTVIIKSTVLNSVGNNAFKNIYKKATIKVPKKKHTAYKALLKGKGQKKTVKIKK